MRKMDALEDFLDGKEPDYEKLKDLLNETYFLKLKTTDLYINRGDFLSRKNAMEKMLINKSDLEIFRDQVFGWFLCWHHMGILYEHPKFMTVDIDKTIENVIAREELLEREDFQRFFPKRGMKTKGCRL